MNTELSLQEKFEYIVRFSQEKDNMGAHPMTLKIMEEVGEFAQAILKETGYLPHKTLKEDVICEAADIIITVLTALGNHYIDTTPYIIVKTLLDQIQLKQEKYEHIVTLR